MNPSELLEFLVATPSVSKQEGLLAMQLANALRCDGFTVHKRGNNLWFEVGQGGPRLLCFYVEQLDREGKPEEALRQFQKAAELNPR